MSWPDEYWDCDDGATCLYHSELGDAVGDHLDSAPLDDWTRKLTVYKYEAVEVDATFLSGSIIESVLENLDAEFGNEACDPTEVTTEMMEAEQAFIKRVLELYSPLSYRVIGEEEIDVPTWVRENETHWLKEEDVRNTLERLEKT